MTGEVASGAPLIPESGSPLPEVRFFPPPSAQPGCILLPGSLLRWASGAGDDAEPWPAGWSFSFLHQDRTRHLVFILTAYDAELDYYEARWPD